MNHLLSLKGDRKMNNDRLSFKEKYSYGVGAIGKDMCIVDGVNLDLG